MPSFTSNNKLKKTFFTLSFLLTITTPLFSQEKNLDIGGNAVKSGELTQLQEQAVIYRNQGLKLQEMGDLEGAIALYQKAVFIDPHLAAVYNDLGILYEAYGFIERAEESYLKCIKINSNYLSAYTNLALIYENKRDLEKALFYWGKRADLGSPGDPWTKRAKARINDIRLVLLNKPFQEERERQVISLMNNVRNLMKDVEKEKAMLQQDKKLLSQKHFEKAKRLYEEKDLAAAIKEALDAQQLNSANEEVEKFIEEVRTRALAN